MKALGRAIKGFMVTLICLMGVLSFAYTFLQNKNPELAEYVDNTVALVLPQTAPGASAHETATGSPYTPGREGLGIENFDDKKLAASYLQWKKQIEDPLLFLTKGTSLSPDLIASLAQGSSSRESLNKAAGISAQDLAKFGQNARELQSLLNKKQVPLDLPKDVQSYLKAAQDSAQELARNAEKASEAGLKAQQGDLSSLGQLSGFASQIKSAAKNLDNYVNRAEDSLGVHD